MPKKHLFFDGKSASVSEKMRGYALRWMGHVVRRQGIILTVVPDN